MDADNTTSLVNAWFNDCTVHQTLQKKFVATVLVPCTIYIHSSPLAFFIKRSRWCFSSCETKGSTLAIAAPEQGAAEGGKATSEPKDKDFKILSNIHRFDKRVSGWMLHLHQHIRRKRRRTKQHLLQLLLCKSTPRTIYQASETRSVVKQFLDNIPKTRSSANNPQITS